MKLIFSLIIYFYVSHLLAFELVAHRGVHQTYNRDGLTNTTCTAIRIDNTGHSYLENTLESIEKAYELGATMVELDIHSTTERSSPDKLAVFHDWTLNCRTNATCESGCKCNDKNECITNEQSFSFLKTLDIGHGYTFDKGNTFPFRGNYFNQIPDFEDILDLIEKYSDKKILVNVKGSKERSTKTFLRIAKNYSLNTRSRLYYPFKYGFEAELREAGIKNQIDQSDKKCLLKYLKTGWYGHFPEECHNKRIFIPIRETLERMIGKPGKLVKFTTVLWGWPDKFIKLAHKHGTKIYASQVDSEEEYNKMIKLDLDGIMTNRIELIGPLHRENN